MYDKPFLTYEEQIEKLKNDYELLVDLNYTTIEIELLKTLSYYDLVNGYKECFMENEKFLKDITLYEIFIFSVKDKEFQNILLHHSITVENIFKNKMAYLIAKKKGVHHDDYLDENKYHVSNPKRQYKLRELLNKLKDICLNPKEQPTLYYKNNHDHIPPWILFKNITFNNIIDLFSFLEKSEKLEIINDYSLFNNSNITDNEKLELFKNMISVTRRFRNKIAHNFKIIGVTLDKIQIQTSVLKKIDTFGILSNIDIQEQRGRNDIFSMFLSILFLLDSKMLCTLFLRDVYSFSLITYSDETNIAIDMSKFYFERLNMPADFSEKIKKIFTNEKNNTIAYLKKK